MTDNLQKLKRKRLPDWLKTPLPKTNKFFHYCLYPTASNGLMRTVVMFFK